MIDCCLHFLGCLPLPLQSRLLSRNPNGNLLPVVLHKHTLAITVASHTIKSANPRIMIDRTLAIGILSLALGAAIPGLMTTAIVGVAVAAVQCQCSCELAIATVRRRLGAQLTVLRIHIGMQLNSHCRSVLAAGAPIRILLPLIPREFVLEKGARQLTVERQKADGLVCLGALCLKVQLETLVIRSVELGKGLLQVIHRRCPAHAGRSSNLLLAVDLLAKDEE